MNVTGVALSTNGQVSYVISLTPNATSGLSVVNPLILTCNAGNAYDPVFTVGGVVY
jgi:hypothetical protein